MLNCAGKPGCNIQARSNGFAGLPDHDFSGNITQIDRSARSADYGAERICQAVDDPPALSTPHTAPACDNYFRLAQRQCPGINSSEVKDFGANIFWG
jgi:hypothetical protein